MIKLLIYIPMFMAFTAFSQVNPDPQQLIHKKDTISYIELQKIFASFCTEELSKPGLDTVEYLKKRCPDLIKVLNTFMVYRKKQLETDTAYDKQIDCFMNFLNAVGDFNKLLRRAYQTCIPNSHCVYIKEIESYYGYFCGDGTYYVIPELEQLPDYIPPPLE